MTDTFLYPPLHNVTSCATAMALQASQYNLNKTTWIWIYDRENRRFKSNQIDIFATRYFAMYDYKKAKQNHKKAIQYHKIPNKIMRDHKRPYKTTIGRSRPCYVLQGHFEIMTFCSNAMEAILILNIFRSFCNFFCLIWKKFRWQTFLVPFL